MIIFWDHTVHLFCIKFTNILPYLQTNTPVLIFKLLKTTHFVYNLPFGKTSKSPKQKISNSDNDTGILNRL